MGYRRLWDLLDSHLAVFRGRRQKQGGGVFFHQRHYQPPFPSTNDFTPTDRRFLGCCVHEFPAKYEKTLDIVLLTAPCMVEKQEVTLWSDVMIQKVSMTAWYTNLNSLINQAFGMPLPVIICCLKAIKKMKFHLGTVFEYSTVYYYGTIMYPFQGMYQVNVRSPQGWFIIISILILYLKEKWYGVEFKIEITGN